MLHFEVLERAGLAVAAISGKVDGDCAARPDTTPARDAFLRRCGVEPARLARVRQFHGTEIHMADEAYLQAFPADNPGCWPAGDGLITNVPGIALGVGVADCVPIWIFDPVRNALGLFHAGREGTVSGMAETGVRTMGERFSCDPGNLVCVVGPSAGPCCYELSEEMAADLGDKGFPILGRKLDLWESNRRQLQQCGVPRTQIIITGHCTLCGDEFHSYRKSGSVQRNLAVGMLA